MVFLRFLRTAVITTAIIGAGLDPQGVATDTIGNVFVADSANSRIRKFSNQVLTTVAGSGTQGSIGDGGPATSAQLNLSGASGLGGVAADSGGNIYIADTANHRVRRVSKGVITTVAGSGVQGLNGDGGAATAAQLSAPEGVAVDNAGNLYIADAGNDRIRKVSNGVITTVAGYGTGFGGDGGAATLAQLSRPEGVAVDDAGNVFIADRANNRIRKVSVNGVITTVAGNGAQGFGGDNGPATSAQLDYPTGVAVDSLGNLYIADANNGRIRKVSNGLISTLAFYGSVYGVTAGRSIGDLFITGTSSVRRISNGVITTIAGTGTIESDFTGDKGPALDAHFGATGAIAVDFAGNIYVADTASNRIRVLAPDPPKITPDGIVPLYSSVPTIQPGSWVSLFGANLAPATTFWNSDFPTSLGGVSVTINNKLAYLWSVSPTQINLQAPDDSTIGTVSVVINTPNGTATSTVRLAPQGPSFSLLGDGKHVAAQIATPSGNGAFGTYDLVGPLNTFSFSTRPVKAGETLTLYGVGFGPTSPPVPAGKAFSGAAPTGTPVSVTIGGITAPVAFSGITQSGLYQINITVPNAPSGDQPIAATVNAVQTPAGPVVSMQ